MRKLGPSLQKMKDFDEGFDIYSALEEALEIYAKGDAEVDADARAAGDR